jgi:hypothetical protein
VKQFVFPARALAQSTEVASWVPLLASPAVIPQEALLDKPAATVLFVKKKALRTSHLT